MQRISFYIVRSLYSKYNAIEPGQQVVKLEGNKYYILEKYIHSTKTVVLGNRVNPSSVALSYIDNKFIDNIQTKSHNETTS